MNIPWGFGSFDRVAFGLINGVWTHPVLDKAMPVITDPQKIPWLLYGVAPVAIGVIFFALSYRGMPLSRISYSLIFCSIACTRPARTGPTLGCLTMSGGGRSPAWPATPNPG